jgi:hypothetical protein
MKIIVLGKGIRSLFQKQPGNGWLQVQRLAAFDYAM